MPKETEQGGEKQGNLLAGKFKSSEDLEQGYTTLEQKMGEQSEEMGNLRKQTQYLTDQLNQPQPPTQEEPIDYNVQLQGIMSKIEDGDLSLSEGMSKTAEITASMATDRATRQFADTQQKQMLEGSREKFAKDHQDFFELQKTGVLDNIKSQLPGLHDDFSAYYEYRSQNAHDEAYEKGKTDMAKIAEGDKGTQNVLPGESSDPNMQKVTEKSKPTTDADMKSGMMDALKAYRDG